MKRQTHPCFECFPLKKDYSLMESYLYMYKSVIFNKTFLYVEKWKNCLSSVMRKNLILLFGI